jgi:hypothetical protein
MEKPKEEPKQSVQEYEQQGLEKYLHELKQEKTFEDVLDESLAKGKVILEELKARNTKQETLEKEAGWEPERMYSEEDMKIAWTNGNNYHRGSLIASSQLTFEKTIEQLKK